MLDVVIPVYDDLGALRAALMGFRRQTDQEFNVHVCCDGGPEAAARAMAEGFGATFDYLGPTKGAGEPGRMAAVRNLGLRRCTAPRVLFVDGDCVPSADVTFTHAAGEGILVGRRMDLARAVADKIRATGAELDPEGATEDIRLEWEGKPGENAALYVAGLTTPLGAVAECLGWTCHISYPTALIRKLGGFWEELRGWSMEDVELARRVLMTGVTARTTMVPVYHLTHPKQVSALSRNVALCDDPTRFSLVRNGGPL